MIDDNLWFSKYDLHFAGGEIVTVSEELYRKIYLRITGTKTLMKPYELPDGGLIFVDQINYSEPNKDAMPLMDYRDQVLAEMEEEVEVARSLEKETEETVDEKLPVDPNEEMSKDKTCGEGDHDDLPIGMVTQTNGVNRYFPFCPDCGYRGKMIRHADVDMKGIIVDLNPKE